MVHDKHVFCLFQSCPIAEHFFSGTSFDPLGWITRFGQLFDKKKQSHYKTSRVCVYTNTRSCAFLMIPLLNANIQDKFACLTSSLGQSIKQVQGSSDHNM